MERKIAVVYNGETKQWDKRNIYLQIYIKLIYNPHTTSLFRWLWVKSEFSAGSWQKEVSVYFNLLYDFVPIWTAFCQKLFFLRGRSSTLSI